MRSCLFSSVALWSVVSARRPEPPTSTGHSLANSLGGPLKGRPRKYATPHGSKTNYPRCPPSRRRRKSPSSPARHLTSDFNTRQMAGGRVAHATLKGPSVVKEIFIGLTLGLIAGGMWKMHHWNEQRKTRSFYDMLDKGQISVVVEE
ncbi:uncharacterized protein [Zea mays]|uniref:uncharacterized protein isoform X2 n=1 Tax=Zea mays TaxID=4577 RepID=UPI0009AABBA4|nr:uncharacterized protein LOC100273814 isoform X2 [Zea mays]|eukprot:XP_020402080.1 uncharacterized protein LOC100273814 isoform X1 [Zea mays]